jgi:hypothetical protein
VLSAFRVQSTAASAFGGGAERRRSASRWNPRWHPNGHLRNPAERRGLPRTRREGGTTDRSGRSRPEPAGRERVSAARLREGRRGSAHSTASVSGGKEAERRRPEREASAPEAQRPPVGGLERTSEARKRPRERAAAPEAHRCSAAAAVAEATKEPQRRRRVRRLGLCRPRTGTRATIFCRSFPRSTAEYHQTNCVKLFVLKNKRAGVSRPYKQKTPGHFTKFKTTSFSLNPSTNQTTSLPTKSTNLTKSHLPNPDAFTKTKHSVSTTTQLRCPTNSIAISKSVRSMWETFLSVKQYSKIHLIHSFPNFYNFFSTNVRRFSTFLPPTKTPFLTFQFFSRITAPAWGSGGSAPQALGVIRGVSPRAGDWGRQPPGGSRGGGGGGGKAARPPQKNQMLAGPARQRISAGCRVGARGGPGWAALAGGCGWGERRRGARPRGWAGWGWGGCLPAGGHLSGAAGSRAGGMVGGVCGPGRH